MPQSRPLPEPQPVPPAAEPSRARARTLSMFLHELGRVSDSVIAEQAGVSRELVGKFRRENGIQSYTGHRGPGSPRRAGAEWALAPSAPDGAGAVQPPPATLPPTPASLPPGSANGRRVTQHRPSRIDPFRHLVGVLFDSEVARLAGVTTAGVQQYRRAHGIAASPGAGGRVSLPPATPPPAVVPPATPAVTGQATRAFRVRAAATVGQHLFYVLGADIAGAARRALLALAMRPGGPWKILSIGDAGDAL